MGCESTKKKYLMKILELGKEIITVETLESIIIKTSFEENEIYSLLQLFLILKPNFEGKITNLQLMELGNFKYSPFGIHLLEALGLKKIKHNYIQLNTKANEDNTENELTNIENNNENHQIDFDVFTIPYMFSPSNDSKA